MDLPFSTAITAVDPQALKTAAERLDNAADLLQGALSGPLFGLQFGPECAGQRHGAAGAVVRAAVDRLTTDARQWQWSARQFAITLRACADEYLQSEAHSAKALG